MVTLMAVAVPLTLKVKSKEEPEFNEVVELARFIQERVSTRWGITLVPEPNLVGF